MTSYNKVIGVFEAFASAHEQLNAFGEGFGVEKATEKGDIEYPLMWVVPDASAVNINTKESQQAFKIFFMDKKNEDDSNAQEIESDMLQIVFDFLSQMQLPDYQDLFTVNPSARVEPINESINNQDAVAGWVLSAQMRIDYLSDWCGVPSTLNPSTGSGSCLPVNVYNSLGELIATVGSGGTYTVPDSAVKDSAGTILHTFPAAKSQTIADSKIKKADGTTDLTAILAEGSKKTTDILKLMSGAEIAADLDTNSDPQKSYIAAHYAPVWKHTEIFNAPPAYVFSYIFGEDVTFNSIVIVSGSYTSVSIYKNDVLQSGLPLTFTAYDRLRVIFTGASTALTVQFLGVFLTHTYPTENRLGTQICDVYIVTSNGICVYNPDIDRVTRIIQMSSLTGGGLTFRNGRTIIMANVYSSSVFQKIDLDSGTNTAQTMQTYLYGDWLSYNGFVWCGNFNSPVYNMRKINKTTLAVASTSAYTSTLTPNATNPGVTAYYNGKIICSTYATQGNCYMMQYDPTADTWSNFISINNAWHTPNSTHLDAANGYLYFLQANTLLGTTVNLYRVNASDLTGLTLVSSFGIILSGSSVNYMRIVGDLCYVYVGLSTASNFFVYRISTGAQLANINCLVGSALAGTAQGCIVDTVRNLAYIAAGNANYLQVIDLTTYTVKGKAYFPTCVNGALYQRPIFTDFDSTKLYY